MKTITIPKPANMPLLTEELFTAFPAWKRPHPLGLARQITDVIIGRRGNELVLTVPDDTDESALLAIVNAHNKDGKSLNEQSAEIDQAARSEYDNIPAWLKNADYQGVEDYIRSNTVGNVTRQQALGAVDAITSLNDVKTVLRNVVGAVYGLVEVNTKIARVVLLVIRFLRNRL